MRFCQLISAGLLLILSCIFRPLNAQEKTQEETNNSTLAKKAHKWGVLPVPTFGSAPETGWYVGAVSLFTYQPFAGQENPGNTRTSNGKLEFNYTQRKQWVLASEWNAFTTDNAFNIRGVANYYKFPENFWGIGNATTEAMVEGYDGRRVEANLQVLKRWADYIYAGPAFTLQHMYDIVPDTSIGLLATDAVTGATGGTSSGLGVVLAYDSRDNVLNAQKGSYVYLSNYYFAPALGSTFQFSRVEVDARTYMPLWFGHTLAVQAVGSFHTGTPPFRMMGLLGSDSHMRGYYRGRYRDRQYMAFQAEYRAPIWWRLGATAFAGAGDVAPTLAGFSASTLKPTAGLGLRILADKEENINMRFDFAWGGKDNFGFYVAFGEAF